ncbi:hypothetical protein L1887_02608 [Cichorium endivia]|nr:hypothetical protein L1887_02608 [Cichorium endivia]
MTNNQEKNTSWTHSFNLSTLNTSPFPNSRLRIIVELHVLVNGKHYKIGITESNTNWSPIKPYLKSSNPVSEDKEEEVEVEDADDVDDSNEPIFSKPNEGENSISSPKILDVGVASTNLMGAAEAKEPPGLAMWKYPTIRITFVI